MPKLLDLFAGAQGCGVGYARAGFRVTSVDIEPHDRHPEVAEFFTADALEVLADVAFCRTFDAIHASPPCQALTTMSNRYRGRGGPTDRHVNLIAPVRDALLRTGRPYVIENVPGAAPHLREPITLHGGMFGLSVYRPRLFEIGGFLAVPTKAKPPTGAIGVYGKAPDGRRLWTRRDGSIQRAACGIEEARRAMGIDWMDWADIKEAVPPTYTEWLGVRIM
jgi:DNA (cytosine-5)-methyltransferase 1